MKRFLLIAASAISTCLSLLTPRAAEPQTGASEAKPLSYFVLVTGGELLEGVYPDAHTPFLTRALRPLGCQCVGSMTVDDNREEIQRALSYAVQRAPLVIVTGGLGPTPNDITRETLSDFARNPLHEHPAAMAELERRFSQPRDQLRPNLRRQTLTPERGGYLKNPAGTAVGLIFDGGGPVLVALPGPPRELQPMVRDELIPFLRQRFGVREFGCSLTLRFVGAGQSLIDQTIKDHVTLAPDVVVTSLFEGSRVDFTFSLPGNSAADRAKLSRLEQSIREHLDPYIYANDSSTLEEIVSQQLKGRGGSVVLVELGSGGSLAAALNNAKAGAGIVTGAYVAATEDAMSRLLQSPPQTGDAKVVARMEAFASAATNRTAAACAIAVSPVERDEKGAPSVVVVYRLPGHGWENQRLVLRDAGEISRATLTTQILDLVRRGLR